MTDLESAPSKTKLAKAVLETLGEKAFEPRVQVERMIRVAGREFVIEMVRKAQEIEANGGLFYERKGVQRRRTLGGVFFFLARQGLAPEFYDKIFPSVEVRQARWKKLREREKLFKKERARALAEEATKAAESAQATVLESVPLSTEKSAQATPSTRVSSQVPKESPPSPPKANESSSSASSPKPAPSPSKPKPKEQLLIAKALAATSTSSQRELKPPSPSVQSKGPSRGRRREAPKLPEVFVSVRTK